MLCALAHVYKEIQERRKSRMIVLNSEIAFCIKCIAQTSCWNCALVVGTSILQIPSKRLRSKRIPSAAIRKLHLRILVEHMMHLAGDNSKFCSAPTSSSSTIICNRVNVQSECMSTSSIHRRRCCCSFSASRDEIHGQEYLTMLAVP